MLTRDLDLSQPRYDQSSYWGRARHFFETTDPRLVLCSDAELDHAKHVVTAYNGGRFEELEHQGIDDEAVWRAKVVYDSAFHPQTGEKNFLPGRMSFQVPGNMSITGCMMAFYRTVPAVIFWQWVNQSFNAVVNYTNRNASDDADDTSVILQAYAGACGASMTVAVALNRAVNAVPALRSGIVGRLVPLFAVAAANCVNVPLMRQREFDTGIDVCAEDGTVVGRSSAAAKMAVSQVVPSRVIMALPGMFFTPLIMSRLEKRFPVMKRVVPGAVATMLVTGFFLTFSTPLCCALFPQRAAISFAQMETPLQEKARAAGFSESTSFFFNKGL
ncbi:MAG: hypothetical protein MHM6MM_006639 [Cercozoa sp. M6MM]